MKKIVYPILLLVLTACKGNQQTTNNESAAIPVAETIADTIAQPEVDAITSATSKPNQVSFNGRIVLPPQRQATIALTMGGIVKKASLLPGQWVAANSVIATLENPEFITLQQTYLDSHAQTEYLLAEYERQKNLSAEQAASQKKFQQSKADFLSMKSRQDAAAAQLSLLGVQTEALLKNGIQPLLEVKAPISGYAANVAMNIGKYINPGEALCELIDKKQPDALPDYLRERSCRHTSRQPGTVSCKRNGDTNLSRYRDFHRTKSRRNQSFARSVCFHQGGKCTIPPRYVCHGTHSETIIDQL